MNNFDITTLENALKAIVTAAGISTHVYTNRPKASTQSNDCVIVRVAGNVEDYGTFGKCRCYVNLLAKDTDNIKNGVKLSVMYNKLISFFPANYQVVENNTVKASYQFGTNPTVLADKSDDFGYHTRTVIFQTLIESL